MSKWILAVVVLFVATIRAMPAVDAPPRPNIVLVVIESFRRDHAGCYGYSRETTPALDALAKEGVRFEQAIAASSWTMPSVASLFTSTQPSVHGVTTSKAVLPDRLATLAGEFHDGGYETAGIVSNPMLHRDFGFGRGFDSYDDYTILLNVDVNLFDNKKRDSQAEKAVTGDAMTRLAVSWMKGKREKEKPFFLFLFYFDPHYDYIPPPPYDGMFQNPKYRGSCDGRGILSLRGKPLTDDDKKNVMALYDGEIRYTDEQVGRLLDELKAEGLCDNTMVVITGDHGEEFWEHGETGHGHSLYDELIRVPLVIMAPQLVKKPMVIQDQVSLMDVMPTLLAAARLPIPDQCQGKSLLPLLDGDNRNFKDRPLFLETEAEARLKAVRTPTRKIVEHPDAKLMEFYSLADDPLEKQNLADTKRETGFKGLIRQFNDWKKAMAAYAPNKPPFTPKVDERILQQIRSLGYVH